MIEEKFLFNGLDPLILFKSKLGMEETLSDQGILVDSLLSALGYGQVDGPVLEPTLPMRVRLSEGSTALVVVGCGGTGSHLVPTLFQFLASKKLTEPSWNVPDLFLIDGDRVEESNLVRQKFTRSDLGKNKAEALAERYSTIWGLNIFHIDQYIEPGSLEKILSGNSTGRMKYQSVIILGAVDNHLARAAIWDFYMKKPQAKYPGWENIFWIDAGNESNYGQAILSGKPSRKNVNYSDRSINWRNAKIGDEIRLIELPTFFDHFPEELINLGNKGPARPGCVALAEIDPQTIQANMMSAFCATSLCMQLFKGLITNTFIYFDSDSGSTKSTILSRNQIIKNNVLMTRSRNQLNDFFKAINQIGLQADDVDSAWLNTPYAKALNASVFQGAES